MDINYHYFAIKALALKAFFSEEEAQTIANYSQMVDDFTDFNTFVAYKVPEYARHLATHLYGDYYIFNPATTGFSTGVDMIKLGIPKYQNIINAPFHFIPYKKKLNETVASRAEWRTLPARMDTSSLMQEIMQNFINKDYGDEPKLMYFGMLLHTFADTYAHQMFSGLNGWENVCQFGGIYKFFDQKSQKNLASDESGYYNLPPIGHAEAGHIPDDTTVRFSMKMKNYRQEEIIYERSNPIEYIRASREIFNVMRLYRAKNGYPEYPDLTFEHWDKLSQQLCEAMRDQNRATQETTWNNVFINEGYTFNYDSNSVFTADAVHNTPSEVLSILERAEPQIGLTLPSLSYTMPDNYYRYNVFADKHRSVVNGVNVAEEELKETREFISQIKKELNYED